MARTRVCIMPVYVCNLRNAYFQVVGGFRNKFYSCIIFPVFKIFINLFYIEHNYFIIRKNSRQKSYLPLKVAIFI